MTLQELDKLAFQNSETPKALNLPELFYFLSMRQLYAYSALRKLSPEAGKHEKQIVLQQYKRFLSDSKYVSYCAQVHIDTGAYVAEYRKAETIDAAIKAADKLVAKLDNVPVTHRWEQHASAN